MELPHLRRVPLLCLVFKLRVLVPLPPSPFHHQPEFPPQPILPILLMEGITPDSGTHPRDITDIIPSGSEFGEASDFVMRKIHRNRRRNSLGTRTHVVSHFLIDETPAVQTAWKQGPVGCLPGGLSSFSGVAATIDTAWRTSDFTHHSQHTW